jgi:hypothetical protein
MWVPGKSSVEMKSKVFNMVLLRDLHTIYMDWWDVARRVVNVTWTDLVSLACIRQVFSQDWFARKEACDFWEAVAAVHMKSRVHNYHKCL